MSILDGGTRSHKPGALEKEAMEREVGEHALLPGWVYGEHVLAAEATGAIPRGPTMIVTEGELLNSCP